jgi:2-hydroxy-6-oxonona-2,4-dienedioate hydrolase
MIDNRITLDGINIRYRDTGGAGPVVLMSSGVGQSVEFWDRQFEAFAQDYRLIAWDYPAHGGSGAADYTVESLARLGVALLDALSVSKAFLLGNSLGGAVSLQMQSLVPDRVQGLVLAAPAFTGPKVFPAFKLFALPGIGKLLTKPSEKGVEMQVSGVFHPDFAPDKTLIGAIRRNVFNKDGQAPFLTFMRATLSLSGVRKPVLAKMRDLYRACDCPILMVHGRQDKIIPFAQSRACAELAANARFEVMEACGHAPQLEHPAAFNALVQKFIREIRAD